MSPSSKGILAGLLLAAPMIFGTLSVNEGWLLPAADETGVAYLIAAPMMAAGDEVGLPWAGWDSADSTTPFAGRAPLTPLLMAQLLVIRPQPHVVALWALAGSAGLMVLFAGWTAGGAAGIGGALLAGTLLVVSTVTVGLVTAIRPEVVAMALIALQLGLMMYKPSWTLAHGTAATGAWLAHPAGLGAVLAALLWGALRTGGPTARVARSAGAALIPLLVLVVGPVDPPSLMHDPAGLLSSAAESSAALLVWAGGGWGLISGLIGLVALPAAALVVALDRVDTPAPPADVHWKDPAAADALAATLRPAAILLASCLLGTALAGIGGGYGSLTAPWALALVPLCTIAGASVARVARRGAKDRLWAGAAAGLWLTATALGALQTVRSHTDDGRAFTHSSWVSSEVIRWVDNRSDPWPVLYTDQPALLQIQSGHASERLPDRVAALVDFEQVFRSRPGGIVLTAASRIPVEEYEERLSLERIVETDMGWVLVPR